MDMFQEFHDDRERFDVRRATRLRRTFTKIRSGPYKQRGEVVPVMLDLALLFVQAQCTRGTQ